MQRRNITVVNVLAYKHPPVQLLSIQVHADQMEHKIGEGTGSSAEQKMLYLQTNCVE